jgi:hypothetical protein
VFASEAQFEAWRTSVSLPMMGTDWMIHRGRSRIRVAPMLIERAEMAPMTCLTAPAKIALCLWVADQADATVRAKIVRVVRSP